MGLEPKNIKTLVELRDFFAENFPSYLVMKSKYDEVIIRTGQTTYVGQDLVKWDPICSCGAPFDENAMVMDMPRCSKCMGCKVCGQILCACPDSALRGGSNEPQIYPWQL